MVTREIVRPSKGAWGKLSDTQQALLIIAVIFTTGFSSAVGIGNLFSLPKQNAEALNQLTPAVDSLTAVVGRQGETMERLACFAERQIDPAFDVQRCLFRASRRE